MSPRRATAAAGALLAVTLAFALMASAGPARSAAPRSIASRTRTLERAVAAGVAPIVRRSTGGQIYDVHARLLVEGHHRLRPRIELTIQLDGVTEYQALIHSRWCPQGCVPVEVPGAGAPVRVLNLEPGGPPQVLLGLANGGANCCFIDQVFSLEGPQDRVVRTERDFLDVRPRPVDLRHDGHDELHCADARFLQAGFTDVAHAAAPIQLLAVSDDSFHDVTDRYPALIRADATRWRAAFRRHLHNGRGYISAWAADEDRLGHERLVARTLLHELHAGHLDGPAGVSVTSAATFLAQLQRLLVRLGYTRR
ncbi:MAG: hypothetical protein JOZ07_00015 [Solirubrobacterales bacterium]|nr:hypothetical protein [Solirubrobacterales bacterium]